MSCYHIRWARSPGAGGLRLACGLFWGCRAGTPAELSGSRLGRPYRAPISFCAEKTQGVALGYRILPRWGAENQGLARCLS